jgi:hypothetical protein
MSYNQSEVRYALGLRIRHVMRLHKICKVLLGNSVIEQEANEANTKKLPGKQKTSRSKGSLDLL